MRDTQCQRIRFQQIENHSQHWGAELHEVDELPPLPFDEVGPLGERSFERAPKRALAGRSAADVLS